MPHKLFGKILHAGHPSKFSGKGNGSDQRHFEIQCQTTFQKKVTGHWHIAINLIKQSEGTSFHL